MAADLAAALSAASAISPRVADDPGRLGEGRARAARAAAARRAVHHGLRPGAVAGAAHRPRRCTPRSLDRLPGARTHYPKLLPLMNAAFASFDLGGFDLVVSSQPRLREERAHRAARARCTSATATRRCATRGTRSFLERRARSARVGAAVLPPCCRGCGAPTCGRRAGRRLRGQLDPRRRADRRRTTAARRRSCTRPSTSTATSAAPRTRRHGRTTSFFGRVVPYKRVDLAVAACARARPPA